MTRRCELCERTTKRGTTQHHLIPRTCHSNRWFKVRFTREQMRQTVDLCHDCHHEIHKQIPSEKTLGRHFNTLELIAEHPQMYRFIEWIRKQK